MYKSLEKWINVPFVLHSFVSRDGTGKEEYVDSDQMCYPEGSVKTVINKNGDSQTSTAQLYVRGTVSLTDSDEVTFEGKRRPVVSCNSFYDTKGQISCRVVYL